jgi:hypothetical protein
MLTQAQIDAYNDVGAIVVPNVLTAEEVRVLSNVTDDFVARARGLTGFPCAPVRSFHPTSSPARVG